jgi:nitronate monooxygenase
MAGGVNTPALAAAVANAGGVGSFGFAYSSPARIDADLRAAQSLTQGVLNANFFLFSPVAAPTAEQFAHARAALQSLPGADGVDLPEPREPWFVDLAPMLEPVWVLKPHILTFHFGAPSAQLVQRAHQVGIAVGATATCVSEAQQIEASGADFVIAQGIEAGGHRGCFDAQRDDATDDNLAALDLTRQLCRHLAIPVVAAGGIMDGHDVRRALQAGAVAAQMGTAFLACEESGASPAHKRLLLEPDRGTVLTRVFSGRRARGLRNAFIDSYGAKAVLPFPIQNTLTGPVRAAAVSRDDGEYQSLWAGTRHARAKSGTAVDLMADLARDLAR